MAQAMEVPPKTESEECADKTPQTRGNEMMVVAKGDLK
jgi:hypothetical protein